MSILWENCDPNVIKLETKKLLQKPVQLGNNKEKQNEKKKTELLFYKENQDWRYNYCRNYN